VDLSVVICTYNRADRLDRALHSIYEARHLGAYHWELLLVDNRSTDRTADVAAGWTDRLPIRYIYEAEPGLSAARNRALAEAHGRLVAFTDDDVEVDPDWLAAIMRARRCWPTASYLAGRILPSYEGQRPSWMTETCESLLAGVVIRFSPPCCHGRLTPDDPRPMGANLAFDADALRTVGGFRTDLGRNGSSLVGGEEVAVLAKLEQLGHHGIYVPDAIVHHHTPADRLRRWFLVRYFAAVGVAAVRMGHITQTGLLGPPRWMVRKVLSTGLAYAAACAVGRREQWLMRMRSFGYYVGATRELFRRRSEACRRAFRAAHHRHVSPAVQ
jgi:glycosyltransferase involved in cell wall biosynthesis